MLKQQKWLGSGTRLFVKDTRRLEEMGKKMPITIRIVSRLTKDKEDSKVAGRHPKKEIRESISVISSPSKRGFSTRKPGNLAPAEESLKSKVDGNYFHRL
jgi:hypothetical protein